MHCHPVLHQETFPSKRLQQKGCHHVLHILLLHISGTQLPSDFSSDDDASDVSDLDKFEEAYTDFRDLTAGVDPRAFGRVGSANTNDDVPGLDLPGGLQTLHTLANVPKSWPLARLTIPLSGFSKQLERLLVGYCMEVSVTNTSPELQLHYVRKFAKDLVILFCPSHGGKNFLPASAGAGPP